MSSRYFRSNRFTLLVTVICTVKKMVGSETDLEVMDIDDEVDFNYLGNDMAESKTDEGHKLDQYRQLVSFYTEAIQLQPHVASHYGNRSGCYIMLSQFKEAIEDAQKAVLLDPKFVKGYIRMVTSFIALGDFETAIKNLFKVKELDPENMAILKYTNTLKQAMELDDTEIANLANFTLSKEGYFILKDANPIGRSVLKNEDNNTTDEDDSVLFQRADKQIRTCKHLGGIFENIDRDRTKKIVNQRINERDVTLLHLAVYYNAKTAVAELLSFGADIQAENVNKTTPLHYVKSVQVARLLIKKGADIINAKDKEGCNILASASLKENNSLIKYLLKKGANSQDAKEYLRLSPDCDDSELLNY